MTWRATVLTLFPDLFPGPLGASLAGRALASGIWSLDTVNIRDHATDRHRTVDDTPFGGGAGMVLRPDIIDAALATVIDSPVIDSTVIDSTVIDSTVIDSTVIDSTGADQRPILCLTPRGTPFTQALATQLATGPGVILLAGRYEGIDQRVIDARGMTEISIGDYVLSGGELPAQIILDACVRLLPGVMGATESATEESHTNNLLEYPHYTRPADWQGRAVPEILLSGHHGEVAAWRRQQAEHITRLRRPDLWARHEAATTQAPVASPARAP